MKCGKGKIWLDPNEVNEISNANSRQNIRRLIKDGLIIKKPGKVHSRFRARKTLEARRKVSLITHYIPMFEENLNQKKTNDMRISYLVCFGIPSGYVARMKSIFYVLFHLAISKIKGLLIFVSNSFCIFLNSP
jgi:hypothetical protein